MTINYSPNQTVTSPQPIDVTVTATASDGKGGQASQSQTIAFIGNRSPTIDSFTHSPSGNYFPVGTQINFLATASDPDGDNVTISFSPSQTITLNEPGAVTVTVTANDGNGEEVSQTTTVNGFEVEIYTVTTPSPQNSFISTDQVSFAARVNGVSGYDNQIDWTGEDDPGGIDSGSLNPVIKIDGSQYTAVPAPPQDTDGRNGKLAYKITASLEINNLIDQDEKIIQQDIIDQLRQEYYDLGVSGKPTRAFITNSGHSMLNYGTYAYWIEDWYTELYSHYSSLQTSYGQNILLSSAYRNPVKQLGFGSANSYHCYGMAIDWDQLSSSENYALWVHSAGATQRYLYDQHHHRIAGPQQQLPFFGTVYDEDGNQILNHQITEFSHGHTAW